MAAVVEASAPAVPRPLAKRVRTGCLTCRERHLKCDEGKPICQNCRKSNRNCKRGFRLNFIDTKVLEEPVVWLVDTENWDVRFEDESREIASDYAGGAERYPIPESNYTLDTTPPPAKRQQLSHHGAAHMLPVSYHNGSPLNSSPINGTRSTIGQSTPTLGHSTPKTNNAYAGGYRDPSTCSPAGPLTPGPPLMQKQPTMLTNPDEVFFMQIFVEEVGIWMDSLDPLKHFSRLLPFKALEEPMLLNAFLACGAQHLLLVNSGYRPDLKDLAIGYSDKATALLARNIQNPEGYNKEMCATTSVILNVYETLCGRARERMHHIKGARALVKGCSWNANSIGVGAACFWLNTTMELLTCLTLSTKLIEDPDNWGVNMDFNYAREVGKEDIWAHRAIFILAKISNFKIAMKNKEIAPSPKAYEEWMNLKRLCDDWESYVPTSMQPMAYLHPYQTQKKVFQTEKKSVFPEIWLIKRCSIVARLIYHTALVTLAQIDPLGPSTPLPEKDDLLSENAIRICGITAHVKDRGVASVAIRSLAIAAECLTARREQEEILEILSRINKEAGWRVDYIGDALKHKWGWQKPVSSAPQANALNITATSLGMLPSSTMSMPPSTSMSMSSTSMSMPNIPLMSSVTMQPVTALTQSLHQAVNYTSPTSSQPPMRHTYDYGPTSGSSSQMQNRYQHQTLQHQQQQHQQHQQHQQNQQQQQHQQHQHQQHHQQPQSRPSSSHQMAYQHALQQQQQHHMHQQQQQHQSQHHQQQQTPRTSPGLSLTPTMGYSGSSGTPFGMGVGVSLSPASLGLGSMPPIRGNDAW
ncbi:hypothetical protein BJ508DRAFT_13414 [Ascobolus immersus RN42]|uniref:Zn(2)-C6 fungal-type domain-containing protein n=1 Tax=Ascobolus immersus RN42 TaxID=1160509 RepID=A0A3N4IH19_ASCIM|nr:hypothetical protein BJ508DRAFT_13414 [Ascobolus immersus RN42]